MEYDYLCMSCSHEFDYCDGVKMLGSDEWVECPHCKSETVKDLTGEG